MLEPEPMHRTARSCLFYGLILLPWLTGCGTSLPPAVVPDLPDASAAAKAMETLDTNHDGFLNDKELEKAPGLKAAIKEVDTDNDGKISQEEIAARIKLWAESGVGRMPITCRVRHKGEPLKGAKVTFLAEPFLGAALQSGSGSTDSAGMAVVSGPHEADPSVIGVSPGFYRVEITKEGEKIPAKYNSQTTLGAEAATGSQAERGLFIDLQY